MLASSVVANKSRVTTANGLRVALFWMRLGPYHLARARALRNSLIDQRGELVLCEVSNQDHYAWSTRSEPREDWIQTLFQGQDYASLRNSQIGASVEQFLTQMRPDVVAVNGWSALEARAALNWARKSRCTAIVMSETKADDGTRRYVKELAKRWVLRGVAGGLVGGQAQRDYLAALGVPREQIFLGYNAVDNAYFSERSSQIRSEREGLAETVPPYFFASARFLARKNLDGLLRAYADYRTTAQQPWGLVIAGSGQEEGNLQRLCANLHLDSVVQWPGFVQYDELPHWYAGAGAFIHPAKAEAWGLVANEAAACSLPLLIANPVGARYELLEEGVTGFAFDPHSDEQITGAMLRVSAMDSEQRADLGAAAKARVDQYGPARFAQGMLSAIDAARNRRSSV